MKRAIAYLGLLTVLLPPLVASAQLSPGPLLRAHESLEGMTRCVRCHALGKKEMDVACLDCHREIEWLQTNQRGLHARVIERECSSCHADHAGRDFDPIELTPKSFDHEDAGWPLEAAHSKLECENCHRRELWKAPARTQRAKTSTRASYLGLDTRCISCHVDDHERQLGEDCLSCHVMESFVAAGKFQHDTTKFPLRGEHRKLECAKCHTQQEPAGKSMLFPARNVAECSACHQDAHNGRLGTRCSDCHSEVTWNSNIGAGFDHSKTRFQLVGAHRSVKCERCHDEKTGWGARPAFGTCSSCHSNPHVSATKQPLLKGDCKGCHDERSFQPSKFDVAAHAKSRFQLEGAHRKTECNDCHKAELPADGKDSLGYFWQFEDRSCANCHGDAHGTQLSELKPANAECTACHDSERFMPSKFGVAEHAQTEFQLTAAHVDVVCARCHSTTRKDLPAPKASAAAGRANFVFQLAERACGDCHADPHQAGKRSQDCQRCHASERWSPTRIDIAGHGKLGLKLEGAHGAVPCIECHAGFGQSGSGSTLLAAASLRSLPFAQKARQCVDCHATQSGGGR